MGRHMCNVCGKWGDWGPGWSWYGSIAGLEDGKVIKVCSNECKVAAIKELASLPPGASPFEARHV